MTALLAKFGAWLVGVLSRELFQWLQTAIQNYIAAKEGQKAAQNEQVVMNNPASSEQDKKDAEKNVLDTH
jgi:hypothetical protein